jgi:DNA-binding beta-propeller fold protein YncE
MLVPGGAHRAAARREGNVGGICSRSVVLAIALLASACGGGGGGSSSGVAASPPVSSTPPPTAQSQIEAGLGTVLQRPVLQCGAGTDTVTADAAPGSVTVFESGPVRPLALSADGQRLYLANAPANCLEVYAVESDGLRLVSAVSVGLEPVAVAERSANEVWVVNHLSDSVSVVRLDGTPRVLRTLLVGDEPRDVVFAGPNRDRAFVTAANRGQNRPGFASASLTTPATGRADVWVFDAAQLDESLNGRPVAIVTLPADVPRALAVSNDGRTVYAASFMSGNRTTVLHRDALNVPKPGITTSADGVAAPGTGLIVRHDGTAWRDEARNDWSGRVKFTLPDEDVFAIDAAAASPAVTARFAGVGTTLFNMAVSPADGRLFVSHTEAFNEVRFEGSGRRGNASVRGRITESRIAVVAPASGSVAAVHLNRHVNFALPQGASLPAAEKAKSLSQPTALVFSPSGDTLYAAAFGSAKVAALPAAALVSGSFVPDASRHIDVPAGPAGLALNAAGTRLFVYSRIAQSVSVVDTATRTVLATRSLFTPEPAAVRDGRRFLYDATLGSANGTVSCASCHVFGDLDHLAWDLGNPDDAMQANPNAYLPLSPRTTPRFHPLKGPMTTQTLRGMKGNGPMHWRGDRTGTARAVVRGQTETLEDAAFKEFNAAFVALLGREAPIGVAQMQSFTDFAMQLAMPPNPVRALDNSLTDDEAAGRNIYLNFPITLLGSCDNCHRLRPAEGQFGTNGLMTFEGGRISENFKIPQLRNMYTKAGMFGFSADGGGATGAQIRGTGFGHDGAVDTLDNFFRDPVFNFPAPADTSRRQVIAFVLAFDSDLLPVVGQQVTWRPGAPEAIEARLTLLRNQAQAGAARRGCDLVARATVNGTAYSALLQADGSWALRGGGARSDAQLRELATVSQPMTFTCLPPGSGRRAALDQA